MDIDALADELVARVMTALSGKADGQVLLPSSPAGSCKLHATSESEKPVLLLLSQEKNPAGLPPPEEAGIQKDLLEASCHLLCARTVAYEPDWKQIEGVIAFGLTIQALGKIAAGMADDSYTKAMSQAFLLGKPVYVPQSQIELLQYEKTAPVPYFMKLREHLTLLEHSGLHVLSSKKLEAFLINPKGELECAPDLYAPEPKRRSAVTEKGLTLTKHLITEQDVAGAGRTGVRKITIGSRAILTDLARDCAQNQKISIIRQ